MEDLWGNIDLEDNGVSDSNAIEILREQARLLDKKTNGIIKATFSKIDYKKTTPEIISQTLLALSETKEEIVESELEGKKDLNSIYSFVKYKFEIFNDTYRFRIFILNYRPVFPIEIDVDEGIKDELNLSSTHRINSDDELRELVTAIFSSTKVQMIIKRMYAQNNKAKNTNE
ncbi:hypothetical protein [Ruminococcus flavefaciens]|uniref:hypothetical protein n=1 Tax=Ruminococcus flavefaciens TaxID=1265 RepID=UPI0003608890|nr:hypothetical protein [Ruminococcus flavefaciens]